MGINTQSTIKKLHLLNLHILDTYIENLISNTIRATDLAPIVMYLSNNNIKSKGDRSLDDSEFVLKLSKKPIGSMSEREKMYYLNHLVLDKYIDALSKNELKAMELSPLVTLLKNNEIISKEKSASKIDILRTKKGEVIETDLFK